MISQGTTIIVNVMHSALRPRWLQDESGEETVFEVISALPRSSEAYAWYDTNKGTLVIHDHDKVAVL